MRLPAHASETRQGRVVAVRGSVVDVFFPGGAPAIFPVPLLLIVMSYRSSASIRSIFS